MGDGHTLFLLFLLIGSLIDFIDTFFFIIIIIILMCHFVPD